MERVLEMINTFNHDIFESLKAIGFKLWMLVAVPNAVFQVRDWLPDWLASPIEWALGGIYAVPWMNAVSFIALVLLAMERFHAQRSKYYDAKFNKAKVIEQRLEAKRAKETHDRDMLKVAEKIGE